MYKSKITEFLKKLSEDELKKFGEFLASPYFNKNQNVVKLFNELKKHYPDFSSKGMSKKLLYKKIISNERYSEQVMRNLSTRIFKLAKTFLSTEYYLNVPHEQSLGLLHQLASKRLDPFFISELNALQKELLGSDNFSSPYFMHLYKMELERINFMILRDKQKDIPEYILAQNNYLIFYFIVELTIAQNNIKINKDTFNIRFDTNLVYEFIHGTDFDRILGYVRKHNIRFGFVVFIHYYKMMCSLYPEKEEYYHKLKKLVEETITQLSKSEMYGIVTALEHYCTIRINQKKFEFYKELFDIYKLAIKHEIFLRGSPPQITATKFRNIYTCAFRLNEHEWIRNFIDGNKKYLSKEGMVVYELAYSQLDFKMGNFDRAVERLDSIQSDLYYIKIDVRRIMLQIYYERNELETALSLLGSFRQFLNSNPQVIPPTRESYVRFINVMTNLIKLKDIPDRKKLKKLRERVESERLPSREWLLEKISGLEK